MNFVLDASVTMCWLLSDGASYLEVALREGLSLATLDDDLMKAAKKAGVRRFTT